MNYIFILSILVLGSSGLVAQGLMLRELLVVFHGNELTLGIILANWVAQEALGVIIFGKYIDKIKNKINIFILLQLLFILFLPVSIYLCRAFKVILGVAFGEALGLYAIFCASFIITFPASFFHGALFGVSCKIFSGLKVKLSCQNHKDSAVSVGKVYSWETIGTILGGIVLTYILIPHLRPFKIIFVLGVANLIICFLLMFIEKVKLRYSILILFSLLLYIFLGINSERIENYSLSKFWAKGSLLSVRNSIYANLAVIKQNEQYTFFSNGQPIITTPYPDIAFVEDFGNLPLLFHPAPNDVLMIGSAAGGLINEVLKYPVKRIDYVEMDTLIVEMLKKYPTPISRSELADERVRVINLDGRYYLRNSNNNFDIELIGISNPTDLSTNRFFTKEFFGLAKSRLKRGGILALWLPGSLTYVSQELKDLNACILNALKNNFNYVRIIPGDYNIYLSSDAKGVTEASAGLIFERLTSRGILSKILTLDYLEYRLSKYWQDWFMRSLLQATSRVNQDLKPVAVFQMLILWNKQFSSRLMHTLNVMKMLDLKGISVFIILLTAILYLFYYRNRKRISIAYNIVTTGFYAMLINLVLIFSFQIFFGYLYYKIGLLISVFMAGIALGSILITINIGKIKKPFGLFMITEAAIVVFSFILILTLEKFVHLEQFAQPIFITLFFVSGVLAGLEFPLASLIYLSQKKMVGEVSGLLYFLDLMGGWFAGILGIVILLPVLGLIDTCFVIALLKISSLFLLALKGSPQA